MSGIKVLAVAGVAVLVTVSVARAIQPPTPPAPAAVQAEALPGKPHLEIPDTEASTCLMCHEDIQKGAVVHSPVAAGMCTSCHEFSGQGEATRVALVGGTAADNTAPLCTMCHDDIAGLLKAPHVHGPVAEGGCTTCHSPHASEQKALLTAPQAELCGTCHADVAEDLDKKDPHKPAADACTLCHDAHGGPNAAQLRADVNPLCLECHSSTAPPPPAGQPGKLFGHVVDVSLVPLMSPTGRVTLDPLMRRNHPIVGHPVRGPKDPLDESKPFSCVSCHAPHGTDTPSLTRFGGSRAEFCVNCHK